MLCLYCTHLQQHLTLVLGDCRCDLADGQLLQDTVWS